MDSVSSRAAHGRIDRYDRNAATIKSLGGNTRDCRILFVNKPVPPPVSRTKPPPPTKKSRSGPSAPGGLTKYAPPSKRSRPPLIPILCAIALFFLEVWFLFVGRERVTVHLLAAIIGLFGSVVLLGWFRQSLNLLRSTSSFSEWAGPFESTRYLSVFVLASWTLGVINLYFSVYEILRP